VKKVWTRDDLLNDDSAKISVQKCSEDIGPIQQVGDELDWNVFVQLTNGKIYGVDFVVSATGVVPNGDLVSLLLVTEVKFAISKQMFGKYRIKASFTYTPLV